MITEIYCNIFVCFMYIYTICNARVDRCERQKNAAYDVHVNENENILTAMCKSYNRKNK